VKQVIGSVLLAQTIVAASAQQPKPLLSPTTEAVCGFIAGKAYYLEASDVKQGLAVDMFVGDARVGQPTKLRFYINQKPGGYPVDNMQIEHEKFMHVVGVRDDLSHFFHIHPVKVAPGAWVVTHVFTSAGDYKIWSDVKWRGASYSFGQPLLSVSGRIGEVDSHTAGAEAFQSGYKVSFHHNKPLTTGNTNLLEFNIRDANGAPVATENYLGAPMHLVLVRTDLSVFLHAHPEPLGKFTSAITFRQTFQEAGDYKLFAQFRPQKTKLPADEAILVEFLATVAPNNEISAKKDVSSNRP